MDISLTRRNFVRTAPLAAATLLSSPDSLLHAATGAAVDGQAGATFEVFPQAKFAEILSGVQGSLGTKDIVAGKGLAISATVSSEAGKIAKEFEYHERRDHIFQVLDGTTVIVVGGTPKNARQTKPGEWLAPDSEGATRLTLNKGDYLSIPRMVPHKRITESKVSLLLISAATPA